MKVSIIGVGRVGGAIAFSLLHRKWRGEMVLLDSDTHKLKGQWLDLSHARNALNNHVNIKTGIMKNIENSDWVVISAGKAREPHQTMEEMYSINIKTIQNICELVKEHTPESKIIMVTNPARRFSLYAERLFNDVRIPDEVLDTYRYQHYKDWDKVLVAGQEILALKGHTDWGVASVVANMITADYPKIIYNSKGKDK